MANIISATIFGSNENDWNQPSGVEMGFPTKNVVFKAIPPTNYSGTICNSQIQLLPTAPSTIQQVYYTNELVGDLVNAANSPSGFPSITIGSQVWMTNNWNGTKFQNGDTIPQVTDTTEWSNLTTPAWCYFDNNPANGNIYGKLYNWYAVNDPRGIAPTGWKVPSYTDIDNLGTYLSGLSVAGGKMKQTGTSLWFTPNSGATNESGWTGLPGGDRGNGSSYLFNNLSLFGLFWTNTSIDSDNSNFYFLQYTTPDLTITIENKKNGYSLRLIQDI